MLANANCNNKRLCSNFAVLQTKTYNNWLYTYFKEVSVWKLKFVSEVGALSNSWYPFRFYKWQWTETGSDSWGYFWDRQFKRQRWQSWQMSLFERHISAPFDLVTGEFVCCRVVKLPSYWIGCKAWSLVFVLLIVCRARTELCWLTL